MRHLASVRTISSINQIEGADRIEVATVDGWKVVAKKGEYKPGDLCVYCEIDSFLPLKDEYKFLKSPIRFNDKEGYRLRTVKLRGQISQGLLLPITNPEWKEGQDVTEELGIIKFEKPISLGKGQSAGLFPSFIRKTDEERVQNLKQYEGYKNYRWYVTEKLDGQSATFFNYDRFGVCSRNLELVESADCRFWHMARKLDLPNKLKSGLCLQGELVGPAIQGNKYKLNEYKIYFFNAFDIAKQSYLPLDELVSTLKDLGLDMVPVLWDNRKLPDREEIISIADGQSKLYECNREGLVWRTLDSINSFKVISNKFLLEE